MNTAPEGFGMSHTSIKLLLSLVFLGLTVSCAGRKGSVGTSAGSATPSGPGLALAPSFRISDIPVPTGFEFDRAQSYVYQDRDREIGSMRYAGRASVGSTTQFFLDEMVQYNWTLINVVEHQTVVLNFEKPEKTCMILLSRTGRGGTEVRIDFRPRGVAAIQPTY